MYCENCGKRVDKESYTCPECGYVLNKKQVKSEVDSDEKTELQRVNTLFIIGFVFSLFCNSIVGLLLTIAAFVNAKRFKENNDKNVPLVKLGIASVIIFVLQIIIFVLITVFSGNLYKETNKYLIGKWNCGVEDKIEFTNKRVIVTSTDNKSIDGIYSTNSTVISGNIKKYKITIKPSYNELENIRGRIEINNNSSIITIDSKVYNCVKE